MRGYIVLLLSCILAFMASCTPKLFRDNQMRPSTSVKMSRGSLMPVFDKLEEAKYYTAQIDFKENSMGGILAVSKLPDEGFRMVMMTAFGVPIFDFSVYRDSFIVNSCLDKLQKKSVLGILERDFRTLFMLNVPQKFSALMYLSKGKKDWIGYGVKADDGECDYIIYPKGTSFVRNIQNGGLIKRMNAIMDDQVVVVHHPKLKLKLILTEVINND